MDDNIKFSDRQFVERPVQPTPQGVDRPAQPAAPRPSEINHISAALLKAVTEQVAVLEKLGEKLRPVTASREFEQSKVSLPDTSTTLGGQLVTILAHVETNTGALEELLANCEL